MNEREARELERHVGQFGYPVVIGDRVVALFYPRPRYLDHARRNGEVVLMEDREQMPESIPEVPAVCAIRRAVLRPISRLGVIVAFEMVEGCPERLRESGIIPLFYRSDD